MSSGVPRSRRISMASSVRWAEYEEMPAYSALPWRTAVSTAPERLLERRVGVQAVRVEDVDVVEAHPLQALVEAREQVLARAPLAVRAGPHVVARLGRDDQLVALRAQVLGQQAPEVDLGRAVRRAVVVGEVEVGDPEVEGAAQDRPLRVDRAVVAEVLPQARARWPAASGRCARSGGRACGVVAVFGGDVGHAPILAYRFAAWPLPSSPAPASPSSRSSTTTGACSSRRPSSTPSTSSSAGSPRSSSRARRASRGRSTSTSASSCARRPRRRSTAAPRSSSAAGTSTTTAPRGSSARRPTPARRRCSRSRPRTPTTCARTTRRSRPARATSRCWPTTSRPSRRRASRSRFCPSCRSPGVKDSSGDAGRLVAELGAYDGPLYVGSSAYLALAGPARCHRRHPLAGQHRPRGLHRRPGRRHGGPARAAARPSRVARGLPRRPQAPARAHGRDAGGRARELKRRYRAVPAGSCSVQ